MIEKLRKTDPTDYQAMVDVGIEGLKIAVTEMPGIPTYGYIGFVTWDEQYWTNWPGAENPYTAALHPLGTVQVHDAVPGAELGTKRNDDWVDS